MPALARAHTLEELALALGGELRSGVSKRAVVGIEPPARAGAGHLCPVLRVAALDEARRAQDRGALLLVDARLSQRERGDWIHAHAAWAMANVLDRCAAHLSDPLIGEGCRIHPTAVLYPGVVLGARVQIEAYAVVGGAGFGYATAPDGTARAIPHLGGVLVDDDAFIGAHCTVHAGALAPTRIGKRTKLDCHVHVGHNCEIGEDCFVAAQTGLAGSVRVGRGVLVGGQVGIADHVTVGDGARLAAKSGVIGDVPPGVTFGGYPAVARTRWLRAIAVVDGLAQRRASRQR